MVFENGGHLGGSLELLDILHCKYFLFPREKEKKG